MGEVWVLKHSQISRLRTVGHTRRIHENAEATESIMLGARGRPCRNHEDMRMKWPAAEPRMNPVRKGVDVKAEGLITLTSHKASDQGFSISSLFKRATTSRYSRSGWVTQIVRQTRRPLGRQTARI